MEYKQNKRLVSFARKMRREMTKEERHLWYDFLKNHAAKFQRQKVLGRYIADFYCAKAKLVIELDGSQHYEENEKTRDAERTRFLEGYDLLVLRIPNNEVTRNFQGVCEHIDGIVQERIVLWQNCGTSMTKTEI